MRVRDRTLLWVAGLSVLLVAVIIGAVATGSVRIDPVVVGQILLNHLGIPAGVTVGLGRLALPVIDGSVPVPTVDVSLYYPFEYEVPDSDQTIVMTLRLPRVLLGGVVGLALAMAGAVMQGFFRNPLADPSIIGVSSGAAIGAVAAIAVPAFVPVGLRPAAFVTGLLTAFAVYMMASEDGRTPVATLLLAGIAVQTFLGAAISYLLLYADESLEEAVYWLMGHLHYATWSDVTYALPVVLVGSLILGFYAEDLNVLLLGEEDAHHLGVEVERTKQVLLALSTVVTAAAVAVSGVIGFVGLVVPHVMRLLVGPDHRILLPTSALAGAAFLIAADTVARSGPAEVPVGIVTAAVGAPFFLYLLQKREVHGL